MRLQRREINHRWEDIYLRFMVFSLLLISITLSAGAFEPVRVAFLPSFGDGWDDYRLLYPELVTNYSN